MEFVRQGGHFGNETQCTLFSKAWRLHEKVKRKMKRKKRQKNEKKKGFVSFNFHFPFSFPFIHCHIVLLFSSNAYAMCKCLVVQINRFYLCYWKWLFMLMFLVRLCIVARCHISLLYVWIVVDSGMLNAHNLPIAWCIVYGLFSSVAKQIDWKTNFSLTFEFIKLNISIAVNATASSSVVEIPTHSI